MTIQEAYNTVLLSINKLHELGVVVTTTKSVFAEKEQEKELLTPYLWQTVVLRCDGQTQVDALNTERDRLIDMGIWFDSGFNPLKKGKTDPVYIEWSLDWSMTVDHTKAPVVLPTISKEFASSICQSFGAISVGIVHPEQQAEAQKLTHKVCQQLPDELIELVTDSIELSQKLTDQDVENVQKWVDKLKSR